jgi:hypothetical protein
MFIKKVLLLLLGFIPLMVNGILAQNTILTKSSNAISIAEHEQKDILMDKILLNYDKNIRPSGKIEIKFSLDLNQILKVRSKDQIFELNTVVDHEWIDPRLAWGNLLFKFF